VLELRANTFVAGQANNQPKQPSRNPPILAMDRPLQELACSALLYLRARITPRSGIYSPAIGGPDEIGAAVKEFTSTLRPRCLAMTAVPQYSNLFTCLYDEPNPIGSIGRGTHYSIFRCVEWLDVTRRPLALPQVHDFAVIWDEDHDTRVIDAIEQIYMAGLLSPVQFIGERKGTLTAIVAARFYFQGSEADTEKYRSAIAAIAQELPDPWTAHLGSFDRSPGNPHQSIYEGIISDSEHRVGLYLANIDSLWQLGTGDYRPAIRPEYPDAAPVIGTLLASPPAIPKPKAFPPGGLLPPTKIA